MWNYIFNKGGSFVPSAQHARTIMQRVFSLPEVFIIIVLAPLTSIVLFDGTSNIKGTSSMFPNCPVSKHSFFSQVYDIFMEFYNLLFVLTGHFLHYCSFCTHKQAISSHKSFAPQSCSSKISNRHFNG